MINPLIMDNINAQGTPLTTMQWFTINGHINLEKYMLLEQLQYIKPEDIYDVMEKMQKKIHKEK